MIGVAAESPWHIWRSFRRETRASMESGTLSEIEDSERFETVDKD
jgi:hypothetical protein